MRKVFTVAALAVLFGSCVSSEPPLTAPGVRLPTVMNGSTETRGATNDSSASGTASPSAANTDASFIGSSSPVDALVAKALGAPISEVRDWIDAETNRSLIDCMAESGFEVSVDDLPPPPYSEQQREVTAVSNFLRMLESVNQSGDVDEQRSALRECLVDEQFQDPLFAFNEWLNNELAAETSRVLSDQRLIDARQTANECAAARGFGDPTSLSNEYFDDANAIYESFQSGSITEAQARSQLQALDEQVVADFATIEECEAPLLVVERTIRAELERDFIEQYGAAIDEELARLRSTLASYGFSGNSVSSQDG